MNKIIIGALIALTVAWNVLADDCTYLRDAIKLYKLNDKTNYPIDTVEQAKDGTGYIFRIVGEAVRGSGKNVIPLYIKYGTLGLEDEFEAPSYPNDNNVVVNVNDASFRKDSFWKCVLTVKNVVPK